MAAVLAAGSVSGAALANELDIMQAPRPSAQHVIDDAGVMNRTTKKSVNDELTRFEVGSGHATAVGWICQLQACHQRRRRQESHDKRESVIDGVMQC